MPQAQRILDASLPGDFAKLRAALKPLVGGNLSRVVYVSYGNPALAADAPCPGGRDGFDVHPAFTADGERLQQVAAFVQTLPAGDQGAGDLRRRRRMRRSPTPTA